MLTLTKIGDWKGTAKLLSGMQARFVKAVRVAVLREAHFLRGHMVKGIASGAPGGQTFAQLSPKTLAIRAFKGFGGTKPLIVTGQLRGSITVVQEGGSGIGGAIFVGVHLSAKRKDGKSMLDLAKLHELGGSWSYVMTRKQRRFLAIALASMGELGRDKGGRFKRLKYKGSGNTTGRVSVHLPARPFIRPVLDLYGQPKDVKMRFLDSLLQSLGGDFKMMGGGS